MPVLVTSQYEIEKQYQETTTYNTMFSQNCQTKTCFTLRLLTRSLCASALTERPAMLVLLRGLGEWTGRM